MHVRESLCCHVVQAKPLSELLQLVLSRSHVLYSAHHRKFLPVLFQCLPYQSRQSVCHAMETTISSMVKCDRPSNSCVHCRPKRKGRFLSMPYIKVKSTNLLPSLQVKVGSWCQHTPWLQTHITDHTNRRR